MSEFEIEVVFALPDDQLLCTVVVSSGATVAEVVSRSELQDKFPQHDFSELAVGIWGRVVSWDQVVKQGERIEIYRPLAMDPREARRRLALLGRTMGSADH